MHTIEDNNCTKKHRSR